ncbi:hypothetical protein V6N12_003675 [Hibiscus sabdariffa]|uniref:Uncharacterized protein n=1 Tax=Hibiscus sabdariffa TaxID=183260 RepID=A0ABR2AMQ4_9ROSI
MATASSCCSQETSSRIHHSERLNSISYVGSFSNGHGYDLGLGASKTLIDTFFGDSSTDNDMIEDLLKIGSVGAEQGHCHSAGTVSVPNVNVLAAAIAVPIQFVQSTNTVELDKNVVVHKTCSIVAKMMASTVTAHEATTGKLGIPASSAQVLSDFDTWLVVQPDAPESARCNSQEAGSRSSNQSSTCSDSIKAKRPCSSPTSTSKDSKGSKAEISIIENSPSPTEVDHQPCRGK